jgi:hypothetical protein
MKSKAFHFVLFFLLQIGFAQNNLLWKGYFSYNEIKAISESETTVYAAAENALFSQNLSSNKIKTTNTIDGLSGQTISALYYSSTFKKTLVGYEDGLIIVRNESDGTILNVVDIVKKQLPSNNKKINHFLEHNGLFYIACDFGIVQFNLATLQFGDTYFIGPSGEEISVNQTAIFNNEIYAVTPNFGIRKGNLSNPNLIDYQQWQVFDSNSWKKSDTILKFLFDSSLTIFRYLSNTRIAEMWIADNSSKIVVLSVFINEYFSKVCLSQLYKLGISISYFL